jgi:hypothetical protein
MFVSRRHPQSPSWDYVGGPHYRFAINTDEHQHQRLLELEQRLAGSDEAGDVYYVAPRFHRQADFDNAYINGLVLEQSVIVPPSEFGNDDGVHFHVTSIETNVAQVLSEPKHPDKQVEWVAIQQRTNTRAQHWANRSGRRLELPELERILMETARERSVMARSDVEAPIARRIDRLATILGCGLVLFGSRETT